ncbi:MAG: CotH kinase family protein [Bacteroidetes bacterium]|nr:CotH kinase family protein [Bacteroidota bacterium]
MQNKILFILLALAINVQSQPYFPAKGRVFNDAEVPRIDISIDPDSLIDIYANVYSDHEYPADFLFTDASGSVSVSNVGFRLRGNTSRTAGKKSFKVSFNAFIPGQKFYGVEKMNLNGEHNDPAIVRSKLFWETAVRLRMPYSRANHVEVYINGNYFGLYINVEHNDENFLQSRYLNNSGNFYKCLYPANLAYLGANPNNYKLGGSAARVYDLKTNTSADDYTDLKDFITALHAPNGPNYQNNLEKLFNVNAFLRAYAFDILTGNWDNYGGNNNNYYLYHNPETGKMDYITYDVDNTYGIDWLNKNWGTRSIYSWSLDTANRPLVTKLLAKADYRNRFSFFMKKMLASYASTSAMVALSDSLKDLISTYVINDTYHSADYGYSFNDFLDAYTQPLGGHAPYGIQDFISTRNSNATAQLVLNNVAPIFSETRHNPFAPYAGDSIYIKSWVEDENPIANVYLHYKINTSGMLDSVLMADDSQHRDDALGDGIFGAGISGANLGDTLYYYLSNSDVFAVKGREPRLGFLSIVVAPKPQLFINELMTKNISTLADNFGEYDDWFELYNAGAVADMNRIFVSDDFTRLGKWNVGNSTLAANGFLLCWADEDGSQGANHANFKLSGSGEKIALSEFNGVNYRILDSLSFGLLANDQSVGCYPDGIKPIVVQGPSTPGNSNLIASVYSLLSEQNFKMYPNPADKQLILDTKNLKNKLELTIFNTAGEKVYSTIFIQNPVFTKNQINIDNLIPGVYCLKIVNQDKVNHVTFIKQ